MNTKEIVEQLKQEHGRISGAIAALEGHGAGNARRGRHPGAKPKITRRPAIALPVGKLKPRRGRRKLSAAAKRKISEAAKRRWAAAKKSGKNSL